MSKEVIKQELYNGKYLVVHKPNGRPRYSISVNKGKKLKDEDPNRLSPSSATGVIDKSNPMIIWATGLYKDFIMESLKNETFTKLEIQEIVREGIDKWRTVKKEAGDIGTFVHDWAEEFAKAKIENKEIPELPKKPDNTDKEKWEKEIEPQVLSGIEGFVDWYKSNNVEFIEVEKIVLSEKYNYWGRFDAIAKVNGKITLIDYKTSKGVYAPFYLQTSAYWGAYEEENGKKFDQAMLLHFQKDPEKAIENGTFHVYKIERSDHEGLYFESFINALNLERLNRAMNTYTYRNFNIEDVKLTQYKGIKISPKSKNKK